ncbi:phosphoglycerate mutase family protein [Pseudoxanthomonas wuyuanensis]
MNRRIFPLLFRAALLLMLLSAAGCASTPRPPANDTALTFVVVRHGEKSSDDAEDPNLSPDGRTRAAELAGLLADAPVVAVYATEYRRTQQTAEPAAAAHGLAVLRYFSKGPADEAAAQWRQRYTQGTVLIVGHSNTVPALVAALCGCEVPAMSEDEYDRLSTIGFDATGKPTLEVRRYGAAGR